MSTTPYYTKDRVERKWYVVDVSGQVLGRAAAGIAKLIIGKSEPQFTPGQDTGAFVVVLNASQIRVTGRKLTDKMYYRIADIQGPAQHFLEDCLKQDSAEVFRDAVSACSHGTSWATGSSPS
jgi:ribosomal protein L13